jgi:hypothetical protein
VGPGIPPVSGKLVSAVISGNFVDLTALVEEPTEREPPSFSLLADQLVVRPAKKRKECVSVIEWLQAFGVCMLIVTAYYVQRIYSFFAMIRTHVIFAFVGFPLIRYSHLFVFRDYSHSCYIRIPLVSL